MYGTRRSWGTVLWLVAAGLVMPLWLQLVGIPAPIPNVTAPSLVGHLVWGLSLGALTHLGGRTVGTRLRRHLRKRAGAF